MEWDFWLILFHFSCARREILLKSFKLRHNRYHDVFEQPKTPSLAGSEPALSLPGDCLVGSWKHGIVKLITYDSDNTLVDFDPLTVIASGDLCPPLITLLSVEIAAYNSFFAAEAAADAALEAEEADLDAEAEASDAAGLNWLMTHWIPS